MKTFIKMLFSRRVLFGIQMAISLILLLVLGINKFLPLKYYIIVVIILLVLPFLFYRLERGKRRYEDGKSHHKDTPATITAKFFHVLLCAVLVFANYYVIITNGFINSISNKTSANVKYSVITLKEDEAVSINDTSGYTFGYLTSSNTTETNRLNQIVTKVNNDLNTTVEISAKDSYKNILSALYEGDVGAIIINETDRDNYIKVKPKFNKETKVIKNYYIKIATSKAKRTEVTTKPFHILISGIDTYGKIDEVSLSDVNILATVNPETKQVLLTSIPRDYYVDIYENAKSRTIGKDKLTHSAKNGISSTQATIEKLLGLDINYYLKMNYTSFLKVIDAIGGIDIYNPYGEFTTRVNFYKIKAGWNHFDSKHALAFVRERHSFGNGDRIRMQNQQMMIKAIVKKMTSAAGLTNLNNVFNAVADSMETNMSGNEIKSLINFEIDTAAVWDIQSYHLDGTNQRQKVFAMVKSFNPNGLYVMMPSQQTITTAKGYINQMMRNERVKVSIKDEKAVADPKANDKYRKK